MNRCYPTLALAGLFAGSILTPAAYATNRNWAGSPTGEADFSTGTNWTPGFTTGWNAGDVAIIENGGTAVISGGTISLAEIRDGNGETGAGHSGHIRQTGGSVTLSDGLVIGRQSDAVGTYDFTGGTLTTSHLRVGGGSATSVGTFNISGAATQLTSGTASDSFVAIGGNGIGTVTIADSALWSHGTGFFAVGTDNNMPKGAGGTGTLNIQSGAKLTITGSGTGGDLYIGKNASGNGTVTISGAGSVIDLGAAGSVILGGTNNGNGGYGTGVLNLDGGTVTARAIVRGTSGTATVNFNGATIKASAANTNFFGSSTTANTAAIAGSSLILKSGGLIFDTNGQAVTIAQGLTGVGGLTKIGAGTLTLSGPNVYGGATILSAGTLALGASNAVADASNLTLNAGTLALNGFSDTVGTLTLAGNATLDYGSAGGPNALTFADSSGISWSGTLTLANFDPATDTLGFTSSGGLTTAQLGAISLAGYYASGVSPAGLVQFAAVPEPGSIALFTTGLLGALIMARRRRAHAAN